jgi:hypothetical protein
MRRITVISEPVMKRLASLHPEGAAQLARINQLVLEATDPALLELCAGCIDSLLQDNAWVPPHPLTSRQQAFIAFTEQFATSVSTLTDAQVARLLESASEDEVYGFVNALYVLDMSRRLDLVVGRILL